MKVFEEYGLQWNIESGGLIIIGCEVIDWLLIYVIINWLPMPWLPRTDSQQSLDSYGFY